VLLFVAWTGEASFERDNTLYCGLWRSPFQVFSPLFTPVRAVLLFPWQLLFVATAPLCLFAAGGWRRRSRVLDGAIAVSIMSIAVTFLWGWLRGASAPQAYYQLWRFLAGLLLALMLPSVIRKAKDLRALAYTILLAALVRGTLAIYFYWAIVRGKIDPTPPYMTNHDDSLLFVCGIIIALSWAVVRGGRVPWLTAVLVNALLLYAVVLNDRRIAWIELVLALALMFLLLPRVKRRRVSRWLLVVAPVILAYVAVGWGRGGAIFAPIKAFATAGSNEDSSSLARQEEVRNLLYTFTTFGNPLLGTGWGVGYKQVTSVYTNFGGAFDEYPYRPHNSLLGIAVFAGFVGIAGIWLVVPVTALLGMQGYQGAAHAASRAAAMTVVCILPAYGVQCYGDIGFQSMTCGLLLGVAMGSAGTLAVWAESSARSDRRPVGP
jgi:hypothetical protein